MPIITIEEGGVKNKSVLCKRIYVRYKEGGGWGTEKNQNYSMVNSKGEYARFFCEYNR